jgi:hypothetical protein
MQNPRVKIKKFFSSGGGSGKILKAGTILEEFQMDHQILESYIRSDTNEMIECVNQALLKSSEAFLNIFAEISFVDSVHKLSNGL